MGRLICFLFLALLELTSTNTCSEQDLCQQRVQVLIKAAGSELWPGCWGHGWCCRDKFSPRNRHGAGTHRASPKTCRVARITASKALTGYCAPVWYRVLQSRTTFSSCCKHCGRGLWNKSNCSGNSPFPMVNTASGTLGLHYSRFPAAFWFLYTFI